MTNRKRAPLSVLLLKLAMSAATLLTAGGLLVIDLAHPQSLLAVSVSGAGAAALFYAGGNTALYVRDFERKQRPARTAARKGNGE